MKNLVKIATFVLALSALTACGTTAASNSSSAAAASSAPFVVGKDAVVATTEGASQYAPTFTVNVKILGGKNDDLFNGTVKLTSDTMWASEFTAEAVADKGLAQDGIATGFVNTIGNYTGGAVGTDYYYWSFTVNGVYASWGCNKYQMRDGDYLFWSFIKYVA
jgi:hypothetical protein